MNEAIRKLRPTDYWRIDEPESWFAYYVPYKKLFLKEGSLITILHEKTIEK
ncbi:hypothetical protein BD780_002727 [Clostridium tetanomorphum]|uniref:Uncharacterized protein n=1 Tax=Clostridium tetanomorphum TaxID=1553 RepID=A0A923EDA1_CLOTT|nr:hypothetical protein [Clostridium tetanomorphum]MBC2399044.1 hypothetical protein [Clostridium tetanomorphum]MBP1862657.1 hypothetical protein [Clostridium tetanomorphum]NRS85502.1 hypothetical protein [Clostridium tetanomorphum]NRZ98616.1 hypothetical protein [Clostridium tetanomorphum]